VRLRVALDPRFARSLVPGAVAFGLSHTLGFVSRNLNVVLISFLSSVTTVGLYAAAAKLVDIVLLVIGIFAQLMLPRFASTFALLEEHDIDRYRRILHSYFSIAFIVGVGLFSFSSTVIVTIFGAEFLPSVVVLRVLTVHFLIESLDAVAGMMLKAANHQNADVRLFAFNPLANLALGSVLIPWFGAIGAALSRLGGVCASFALRSRFLPAIGVGTAWLRLAARPLAVCAMTGALTSQLVNRMPPPISMLIYAGVSAAVLVAIAPSDVEVSETGDRVRARPPSPGGSG
jgi:O-antigen/teichoic acid export membrane protein